MSDPVVVHCDVAVNDAPDAPVIRPYVSTVKTGMTVELPYVPVPPGLNATVGRSPEAIVFHEGVVPPLRN
jgi:hypothetical protein